MDKGKYIGVLILLLVFAACQKPSQNDYAAENGVDYGLAQMRKAQVRQVEYDLSFHIPDAIEDAITAQLNLSFTLQTLNNPVILDFKPDREHPLAVSVNGKTARAEIKNEHIVLAPSYFVEGKNEVRIDFVAGEQSLNRNDDFLFTLLVPDRARTLFPCFDQPDMKATYTLHLETPKDWKVICASKLIREETTDTSIIRDFGASDLMSTYLFSFVAGTFSEAQQDVDGMHMTLLHQETDPKKIEQSVDLIFSLHRQSVDFLERYTETPFPFQKLDFAAIYSHPYGGMEHVGAIQYDQSRIFLDKDASINQKIKQAKLIAHETSHMWFGDLVTMQWFDDVWLKEVFANFMADKIVNPAFPNIDHSLKFMCEHYPRAYGIDRTEGANPIRQNLENLNSAGSLYGNIIYNKAPIMMRQLEALLGEEAFREGVVEYLDTYKNTNAVWNDLIRIFDKKTEMDLYQWSQNWVNSPGRPVFDSEVSYKDGHIDAFNITQTAEDGSDKIMPQVFEIAFIYPDSVHTLEVLSSQQNTDVAEAAGLAEPLQIIYNSNGFGYGVFPLEKEDITSIPALKNEVSRAYSYINLFENALNGTVGAAACLDVLESGLRAEKNELILSLIGGYTESIYWKYLNKEAQEKAQAPLEALLYARLQGDGNTSIKKAVFSVYRSIAYNEVGRERLYEIWNRQLTINDLNLNQDDYTELAMQLALFQHAEAEQILDAARKELSDKNRLARFDFIRPALSQDAQERNAYFTSFADEKNRHVESWVESACSYVHHPLHQKSAIENLHLSLELLEEIQRTGDIFFPKDWLDQTIGQYTSKEALAIVNSYLEGHPELDSKLRDKVLQSADAMVRNNTE